MRTNNWAFQISRSIYDSDIWMKPPEWLKVWIYLLWRVNFEDNNLFKRWENLFNYQVIAIECWVSYNVVNKCINFLKLAKQVSTRKTTRGVVLVINNYDEYQNLTNYRQNQSKTEAKQKQNESYTITEQWNNKTNKEYISCDWIIRDDILSEMRSFINTWNDRLKEDRKITDKLETEYLSMRKKYTVEDLRKAFTWYYEKKKESKEYRISPLAFIKQPNWIPNYL